MVHLPVIRIGCAGWSSGTLPAGSGSQLERYAQLFNAVEINTSFYRAHQPATYLRWGSAVPEDFRFAVKMPRLISHMKRLRDCEEPLQRFLAETAHLGERLGVLLLQLPPTLGFDPTVAATFFQRLRALYTGPLACEPRHPSWFTPVADAWLRQWDVSRVAADPAVLVRARVPGGDHQLEYLRLHGSPRRYYSAYDEQALQRVARWLRRPSAVTGERWCLFDNTAGGNATGNALRLLELCR